MVEFGKLPDIFRIDCHIYESNSFNITTFALDSD